MKRLRYCFIILIAFACEKQNAVDGCADSVTLSQPPCQTYINVLNNTCILLSAVGSAFGIELEKYVYHHNGTNYDRIEVYYRNPNTNFPDKPNKTIELSYDGEKIKEVLIKSPDMPDTYKRNYFTYQGTEVIIGFELITNNKVTFKEENKQRYLITPEDNFYPDPQNLIWLGREYQDGNNVRVAESSIDGLCLIDNNRWKFTSKLSYDSNPNVFKDYAVRFALGGETGWATQFWFANNKNNVNVSTTLLNDPLLVSQNCYTFLKRNDKLWIKKFDYGTNKNSVTFTYSCE